jgi:antitoxin component YwqK of YwqJK toxin-antitoxin module
MSSKRTLYYCDKGLKLFEKWTNTKFQAHRLNGPAITYYDEYGNVTCEQWISNGKKHRLNGPAELTYYSNGMVAYEMWCVDGVPHRADGPAYVARDKNGVPTKETWFNRGKGKGEYKCKESDYYIDER